MLFNSFQFLFVFLPITLIGFFWIARHRRIWAAGWLALASLFFYGYWDERYIVLLLTSIVFNYAAGRQILHLQGKGRRLCLASAIAANLCLLAYYKYADFFIASTNAVTGTDWHLLNIVLPIGISFFTFTQIAFLVDSYQNKVKEYNFVHYLLFVTYFPHLIAGPVLHHAEMMPQFKESETYRVSAQNFAVGFTIFFIGLAKKVLIADNLAPYASAVFDAPGSPSLLIAWAGVLAYTFQLYFDFSAYSDMAIGISRLFGIRLPLNFDSPYKALNIADFWRRWHMTLSRFLRDYLYFPLGGNRKGSTRRYLNLMVTMLLGGLWHGAGWTFVIWGGLHGLYLVIHQAWIAIARRLRISTEGWLWKAMAWLLTFGGVSVAWTYFRASDLEVAHSILGGMSGMNGVALPEAVGNMLGSLRAILESAGVQFYLGGGTSFVQSWMWIVIAALISFFFPNTQQLLAHYEPAIDFKMRGIGRLMWRPNMRWSLGIGVLAAVCLLSLNRPSEFLYFQF